MGVLDQYHRDLSAKSLSFYSNTVTTVVNGALVDELIAKSESAGKCNARICLHPGPDSNFHEMIILERKGYYFPPHRHVGKAQSIHILRGTAAVFVFANDGEIDHCSVLGYNQAIRIGENRYHLTLPLTDYVVYHECKPGPFLKEGDSIFADWAPHRDKVPAVKEYLRELQERLLTKAP